MKNVLIGAVLLAALAVTGAAEPKVYMLGQGVFFDKNGNCLDKNNKIIKGTIIARKLAGPPLYDRIDERCEDGQRSGLKIVYDAVSGRQKQKFHLPTKHKDNNYRY